MCGVQVCETPPLHTSNIFEHTFRSTHYVFRALIYFAHRIITEDQSCTAFSLSASLQESITPDHREMPSRPALSSHGRTPCTICTIKCKSASACAAYRQRPNVASKRRGSHILARRALRLTSHWSLTWRLINRRPQCARPVSPHAPHTLYRSTRSRPPGPLGGRRATGAPPQCPSTGHCGSAHPPASCRVATASAHSRGT